MHWNHRVWKRTHDDGTEWYGIHETFYEVDDADEKPSPTLNADAVEGESIAELRETLNRMLVCLERPVLDYDALESVEGGDRT